MKQLAGNLARHEQGAAVIELALAMPFLALLVIGMVQLSNGYSTKLQVEQVAQRVVEKWQGSGFDTTQTATYQSEAAAAAGIATSAVTVDYWLECNGTRQASYSSTCSSGQTYARYASIDIQKSYTPMFSLTAFSGASGDSYTIHGRAGLRFQ